MTTYLRQVRLDARAIWPRDARKRLFVCPFRRCRLKRMSLPSTLDHLSPGERRALEMFLPRVRELLGPDLHDLRLFGSRARAEGHEESDLDVALVVSPAGGERRKEVYGLAYDVMIETGVEVAPLVIERLRLDELRASERRIALDIDREGIAL